MEINSYPTWVTSLIVVVGVCIQMKIYMLIANAIGDKLGIGKNVIRLIEKISKNKLVS